jgi:hypothetical protein
MGSDVRLSFLAATAVAREVIASAEVVGAWDGPSALSKFSVSGLAGHLARALFTVTDYLAAAPPEGVSVVTAAEYFASMLPNNDIDSELNVAIRARGEEQASAGHAALLARFDQALAHLTEQLPLEPSGRLLQVIGGRAILLDEYLGTRLVELALHIDDLCVSAGIPTPATPGTEAAIRTLVDVARVRHGDLAVLRALGRRERDPDQVLRVF